MYVIHIRGTMCSGKTYITKPFLVDPDIAFWDILDFYKRHECFREDNTMDWDKWDKAKDKITVELSDFLAVNKDKTVCIVESGTNVRVEALLRSSDLDVIDIELEVPDNKVLKERAAERGLKWDQVRDYTKMYLKRHAGRKEEWVTQREATLTLAAYIVGPVKVSIIGTAGRKEDKDKMSRALYGKMYNHMINELIRLQLRPDVVQLVSGGAAWSDHLAVSLYLGNHADNLMLHFPAPFDFIGDKVFVGGRTADTANYYHKLFSEKMGGSTLDGIAKAIEKGAVWQVTDGFKNRNLKVAKCNLLIAFTWGEGDVLKDGGTRHTWDNSDCPIKIHVPLSTL